MAWSWDAAEADSATGEVPRGFRATPLKIGDRLYVSTALNQVVALDAGTGALEWAYDPRAYEFETPTHGGLASRGVAYWSDGTGEERIVFATGGMQLFTLDPETGALDRDFGEDGFVDLMLGLGRPIDRPDYNMKSPPTICGNTIVLGSIVNDLGLTRQMPPGHVRGYDVRTGAMKWIFHTIPQEDELALETWEDESWRYTGNTNVWSWMSCDEELGFVYLPIGTPSDDWYGGHRLGDNLFAESLVALDADTGEKIWHFQAVHHGVWDYDFPTAPNLVDIVVDGRPIKAVVQVSKQAFAYVFDRVTGEPVWPIEERPVPASTVPGERLSSTQPFPTKPPAFDRQGVTVDDLIDFTPELRQQALDIIDDFVIGPIFTPPIVAGYDGKEGVIQVPGIIGDGSDVGPLGWQAQGAVNGNALLVTKTLLFANQGVTPDDPEFTQLGVMRAFDKATGDVVWERPIDTSPRGAPMTYLHEGKQYLVLGVGGGDSPPGLRAYALP